MAKFHLNKLPKQKRIQMIGEFYDVFSCLKNREEIRLFLKDLLTPDEIANLMRRIEVATLLTAVFTYGHIGQMLGVGKDKINNVQKSLIRNGQGYKTVVKRLLDKRKRRLKNQRKWEKTANSPFGATKQRHPVYFCLFNLIDEISESLKDDKSFEKEALFLTPSSGVRSGSETKNE